MTRAILIEPSGAGRIVQLGGLEHMQALVGGFIEGHALGDTAPHMVFVNEDGKRLGLAPNAFVTKLLKSRLRTGDSFCGPALVVRVAPDGSNADVDPEIEAVLLDTGAFT